MKEGGPGEQLKALIALVQGYRTEDVEWKDQDFTPSVNAPERFQLVLEKQKIPKLLMSTFKKVVGAFNRLKAKAGVKTDPSASKLLRDASEPCPTGMVKIDFWFFLSWTMNCRW